MDALWFLWGEQPLIQNVYQVCTPFAPIHGQFNDGEGSHDNQQNTPEWKCLSSSIAYFISQGWPQHPRDFGMRLVPKADLDQQLHLPLPNPYHIWTMNHMVTFSRPTGLIGIPGYPGASQSKVLANINRDIRVSRCKSRGIAIHKLSKYARIC